MGKKLKKTDTYEHIDEEEQSLRDELMQLANINGYKASGVLTHTGEILAGDSIDKQIDLQNVGRVFNDIFHAAHRASGEIGMEACLETAIKTPKGIILMRCSGVDAPAHFHMITILSPDGNQTLVRIEMEKIVPQIENLLK